jgi:hypothetical protein
MNFQDNILKSKEFFLGILLLLLGACSCFALLKMNGVGFESSFNFSDFIGNFKPMESGVRFRPNGSMVWQDIHNQDRLKVRSGDSIFTSEDSSAEVDLIGGSNLIISPSSLVVFTKIKNLTASEQNRSLIQVKKGHVKIEFKNISVEPMLIELKGKIYQVEIPESIVTENKQVLINVDTAIDKPVITMNAIDENPEKISLPTEIKPIEVQLDKKNNESIVDEIDKSKKIEIQNQVAIRVFKEELKQLTLPKKRFIAEDLLQKDLTEIVDRKVASVSVPKPVVVETNVGTKESSDDDQKKIAENPISNVSPSGQWPAFSEFKFKYMQGFYRLKGVQNSNGSIGILGSESWKGFEIEWEPHLNAYTSLDFGLKYAFLEILDLSTESLQGRSQNLNGVFVGLNRELSPSFSAGVKIGQSSRLLYRFLDGATIKIDKANVFFGNFNFNYRPFVSPYMSCIIAGYFGLNAPFSNDLYSTKTGLSYGGSVSVIQKVKGIGIFAEPYLRNEFIPTSEINYDELELGLMFGLKFRIDSSE